MVSLFRSLLWLALFAICTFAFSVLFEYGPSGYLGNAKANWDKLRSQTAQIWQKKGL